MNNQLYLNNREAGLIINALVTVQQSGISKEYQIEFQKIINKIRNSQISEEFVND